MKMTMTFKSPQVAKDMSGFIKQAGGNSTWDRLGEYLDKECNDKNVYQKIARPEFISFVLEFCNEKGQNAKHLGAPNWPARWLTSVTFTKEEDSITRMTLKSEIVDNCTSAELEAFIAERAGMTQGWNGSLDRFEELLENR